ncbi:MAG: hypothetical protein HY738_09965 [Bacteroidia bacterium]|nr:hypothetical protein [Bacteroidia bacterium]
MKCKLKIPYQQLSGNMNQREVPCFQTTTLDGLAFEPVAKEMIGADSFQQPSV